MKFDTNSQLWLDDNNQPLPVQPPKPYGGDNGFSITSNQNPINFNVPNFANSNLVENSMPFSTKTSDGQNYQMGNYNFDVKPFDFNTQMQKPAEMGTFDKVNLSQTANMMQGFKDNLPDLSNPNLVVNSNPAQNTNTTTNYGNIFGNLGQSYSLESSLYALGGALGKKDYTGMTQQEINRSKTNDVVTGVAAAGKALLGGARTLTSGMSTAHMNNWIMNENKKLRRDALINNAPDVSYAYSAVGGAPMYADGGEVKIAPPISSELEGYTGQVPLEELPQENYTPNQVVKSYLTGRPYGFDFNSNVTNDTIREAAQLIAESRINRNNTDSSSTDDKKVESVIDTAKEQSVKKSVSEKPNTANVTSKTNDIFKKFQNNVQGVSNYDLGKAYYDLMKEGDKDAAGYVKKELQNRNGWSSEIDEIINNNSKNKTTQQVTKKEKNIDPVKQESLRKQIFSEPFSYLDGNTGVKKDPIENAVLNTLTFGLPNITTGLANIIETGGKDGKMEFASGLVDAIPLAGKLFKAPSLAFDLFSKGTTKGLITGAEATNTATKSKIAEQLLNIASKTKTPLTSQQAKMVEVADNFLKGLNSTSKTKPQFLIEGNKALNSLYYGTKTLKTIDDVRRSSTKKYQDGGQVDDVMSQLQQAVDSGEMSQEEAQAYLQQSQIDSQGVQTQEQQGGLEQQLMNAVQNGEITEEQAMQYLQQNNTAQPQQAQVSPEDAQQQLALAVQNGEISQEEAQTYLQQLYGEVDVNSQPKEPYTGQIREKLSPEQYLTGEYTTGDDSKPYNSEVESGEYLNKDGLTQQVVGDKHSRGGEKVNLEDGTIVISDDKRLGANNAKAISLQTGMKLKAGDTYAQVIDIFTKKIGLEKLNKDQEELFKRLQKVESKGNSKTQELNNEFLNAKINDIEEKKKSLLGQREQLVQALFQMQEQDKEKDEVSYRGNVPKFQSGTLYSLDRYGNDAYQYYLDHWKNDPTYKYRDYNPMRERLKTFALDNNIAIPEGFDRFNESQMDAFAGQLQKAVPDNIARHYGTYVEPTQSGLQWLVDNNIINKDNNALKNVINKDGKITIGSYGSLNEAQQKEVANAVDGMVGDDDKVNAYATANFRDSKWFYRRPKDETIYYKNKDEFDKITADSENLGNNVYFSGKTGAYFNPLLLQEKVLGSQQEVDDYIKKYGNSPDKIHTNFFSEGDPTTFYHVTAKDPSPEQSATPQVNNNIVSRKRRNNFLLPDQSTLPPEGLRAVPKYDIRYNYMDNIKLSPEQNLLENYRAYNEAQGKMEGLPDMMNHANLAMLTGNVAQANNQAINQINAQNAQMAQQVAQNNLGILNKQAEMDVNLADQYDQRMNRALDVTRKDLEGYYDFNRKVNVGEFNTRHQMALLNDLFDKYGINSDGTVAFDPKTNAPMEINRMDAISAARALDLEEKRRKASTTSKNTEKKTISGNWSKNK